MALNIGNVDSLHAIRRHVGSVAKRLGFCARYSGFDPFTKKISVWPTGSCYVTCIVLSCSHDTGEIIVRAKLKKKG